MTREFLLKIKSLLTYILIFLVMVLATGVVAFLYGRQTKENELENDGTKEITSRVVIQAINDQYFVVTKTLFLEEDVEIKISENSDWSNLLWGKTVTAQGMVRTDLGVDMKKLENSDVEINHGKKRIEINMPRAQILDSSIYGDLEVESKSGIITSIKELFKDGNEDYNLAASELIKQAEDSINEDEQLFDDAEDESAKLIELILKDFGYEVVVR